MKYKIFNHKSYLEILFNNTFYLLPSNILTYKQEFYSGNEVEYLYGISLFCFRFNLMIITRKDL